MAVTVGQFLFDYLHKQGVENAFGIPGDFVLPTVRHLDASPIKFYTMTHEPSIAFAADCYARSKGLGVAVATYCVGGLNMLNGIAGAYAESSPVLVISGGPSPKDRQGDPMFHHKVKTVDTQHNIYKEVTCASAVLDDPRKAASEIVRVVEEIKRTSKPGYIEVPFDVVDMPILMPSEFPTALETPPSDQVVLKACVDDIVERIENAKKPVIIAGVELHRFKLTDYAPKIAEQFNIPIAASIMGKSVVSETHPLYIGVYSGAISDPICLEYVQDSDCVIILGAYISDVFLGFNNESLDRENTIIITQDKKRVGVHSYEDIHLSDILEELSSRNVSQKPPFTNPNPVKDPIPFDNSTAEEPLDAESLFNILGNRLGKNNSIVCDTGDALIGAIGIRMDKRKRFFSDAYYLSMGFAAPATIGACIADPEAKVVALIGDGAFQMTGMELSTCAKYKLAPIVIVINNDGYGTQRHIIDGDFNNITQWKYHKLPEVLGYGTGVQATTKGEMDTAIQHALTSDTLFIIEAVIPRDDCSPSLRRMGEALGKLRDKEKGN